MHNRPFGYTMVLDSGYGPSEYPVSLAPISVDEQQGVLFTAVVELRKRKRTKATMARR